jgi:hypothetical protein
MIGEMGICTRPERMIPWWTSSRLLTSSLTMFSDQVTIATGYFLSMDDPTWEAP